MCGRYTLSIDVQDLPGLFELAEAPPPPPDLEMALPRYNVAPTQPVLVIRRGADGRRRAAWAKWGLIPGGAKDPRVGARMINARAETVFERGAFKAAVRKRRCLVPTDGFFEWKKSGKKKLPHHIRKAGGGVYAMAGIWSTWRSPEGEVVESCSVITTEANTKVAPLHDRMPVILPPEHFDLWLDPDVQDDERLAALLVPAPEDELEVVPVSTAVNSVKNDDPSCLAPVEVKGQLDLL